MRDVCVEDYEISGHFFLPISAALSERTFNLVQRVHEAYNDISLVVITGSSIAVTDRRACVWTCLQVSVPIMDCNSHISFRSIVAECAVFVGCDESVQ